jgi:hypothetical protein
VAFVLVAAAASAARKAIAEVALELARTRNLNCPAARAKILIIGSKLRPVHTLGVLPRSALLAIDHQTVRFVNTAEAINILVGNRIGHWWPEMP